MKVVSSGQGVKHFKSHHTRMEFDPEQRIWHTEFTFFITSCYPSRPQREA